MLRRRRPRVAGAVLSWKQTFVQDSKQRIDGWRITEMGCAVKVRDIRWMKKVGERVRKLRTREAVSLAWSVP